MNDYLTVLKNYATFTGRARRREYWMFSLINGIIIILLEVLLMVGGFSMTGASADGSVSPIAWVGIALMSVYTLGVLVPSLAVSVRRLHDTGRTGWLYLITLIPFVGSLILLVFLVQDSQPGDNKWGPNPKGAVAVTPAF
ncbi:DUF805 domain-containing protein [Deinococcus sonorensis]|uniref:DUF805 domain-containing protein n=2 Tax=Deinococcus sonorensis TaxID=309891 RepID=A0AAU7UEG1_9DEIO